MRDIDPVINLDHMGSVDLPKDIKNELQLAKLYASNKEGLDSNVAELFDKMMREKDRYRIVFSAPRFFPSLDWFAFISQFDLWIPILNCKASQDFMNLKLAPNKILAGLPITGYNGDFFTIDEMKPVHSKEQYKKMRSWLRKFLRKFRMELRGYKFYEEAEEIVKIQLNRAIEDYCNEEKPLKEEEYVKVIPTISSLLVNSINRLGTGIFEKLSDWPMYKWPEDIKTTLPQNDENNSKFLEEFLGRKTAIRNFCVPFNTEKDIADFYIEPLLCCLKSTGLFEDRENVEVVIDSSFLRKNKDILHFYGKKDLSVDLIEKRTYNRDTNEDIFTERTILQDIAEYGLDGLENKILPILKDKKLFF